MHTMSAMRATDGQLVRQALAGDSGAVALLWTRYEQRVHAIVRAHVSSPEDQEDLTQDVLLRAVEGLPRLRMPDQFRAWLDQVARRRCIDHLRRKGRVRFQSLEPTPEDDEEPSSREYASTDPGVEDLVVSGALQEATSDALSELSAAGRKAFLMRATDHASLREISAAIGVSEGAAKSLVYRARRSLERELDPFLAA
jgi:RNA polymerase sigma-70 factor, ECF subfamily